VTYDSLLFRESIVYLVFYFKIFIKKGKYVLLGYLYGNVKYALASDVLIVGDLLSWEQYSLNEIILLRERLKEKYM